MDTSISNKFVCEFKDKCPLMKQNIPCPFNKIKAMTIDEILTFINNSSPTEIENIMNNFRECIKLKEIRKVKATA